MKKVIFLLLNIFLLANLYANKIYHDGMISRGSKCLIVDNKINVRADCSTDAKKLFQVNAGTIVDVEERCGEEMYIEGAWSHWYKISCYMGEGYILGRWMTSVYGECDLRNGYARYDYIACQFLFEEHDDGCCGLDSGEYIDEEILLVRGATVKKLTGISLLSHGISSFPCTEIQVEQNSGVFGNNPIVLFIKKMGYGAGSLTNCSVCFLTDEKVLTEICYLDTCVEIPFARNQVIYFPNKSYDVYNNEWNDIPLLEQNNSKEILVYTKDGEIDYNLHITYKSEKLSEYYWNGETFRYINLK